ncbi:uncharacterized protein KQ657_004248 [Scheffersomyces spartinae]|uniref:separase n=1 Tax=Scheffersomyces spartinae TaxID=45513 RepID=A0A9P7VAY2_9ASCO|nr:uncharacterized protein KQ657_004248 [Scheffersomyces spartinae]KAG7194577.1 hypothetical protein KQ657_004248 [Scheffersomyces spartinae]
MLSNTVSDGDKLDLFLKSSFANPLETSKKINHIVASSKEIETIANRQLNELLTTTTAVNNSELVYNSFACLYLLDKLGEKRCSIAKRHQLYVVRLLETKQLAQCFKHLVLARRALGKKKPTFNGSVTVSDLIDAVEIDQSLKGIISVGITYYFVALQAILQYVSINVKSLLAGNDPYIRREDIQSIVHCFHSSSTFGQLLSKEGDHIEIDHNQSTRYTNNCIKLIKGYYKVFQALNVRSQCQLPEIVVARDCILLKLMQLDKSIEKQQIQSYVDLISYDPQLVKFVEDLSIPGGHFDISLIQIHFRRQSASVCPDQAIERFMVDPSPIELENVKYGLFTGQKTLLENDTLLRKLSRYSIPLSTTGFEFAKAVSKYLLTELTSPSSSSGLKQKLNSIQLRAIDTFLTFLKNAMATSTASPSSQMVCIIQSLHDLLKLAESTSRSRMLSNLLYNLGNRSRNPNHWSLSIQYECDIYKCSPTSENWAFYETKAMKVSNVLLGMGFAKSSLTIMLDYFHTSQIRTESTFKSQVIHLFVKIITKDNGLVIDKLKSMCKSNLVSEKYLLQLMLQVFQYCEKLLDATVKTTVCNTLIKTLSFQDPLLQLQFQLGYYHTNGITEVMDLPLLQDIPAGSILNCDLYLQKLTHFGWSDLLYDKCQLEFNLWAVQTSSIDSVGDDEIIKSFILFLELNALYGSMVLNINKIVKMNILNPEMIFFLNYKLAVALSRLGFYGDMYKQIKLLMNVIKENRIISIPSILSFKLLQLDYAISIRNKETAISQFNKILKFVKSKPELDISESTKLSLPEKFQALLLLAHFQTLSAKLNIFLEDYVGAYRNCKVSLKILNSIMVKLGPNFPKIQYTHIKLNAVVLLLVSYVSIIQNLNYMGVSRDIRFYVRGLLELCSSLNSPVRKVLVLYEIIGLSLLLRNSEEVSIHYESFVDQWRFSIVSNCASLATVKQAVEILLGNSVGTINIQSWKTLDEVGASKISSLTALNENFVFEFQKLCRLVTPNVAYLNPNITSKSEKDDVLDQVNIIKEKIFEYKSSIFKSFAYLCPGAINAIEGGQLEGNVMQALDKLVSYKEFLIRLSKSKVFHDCPNLANQEVYKLLHLCFSLLSQVTALKPGSTALNDLLQLQDSYLENPIDNEMKIHKSAQGYKQLFPDKISIDSYAETESKLGSNFCNNLPANWKVVGIDTCQLTGDLLLTECSKGKEPRFIRLNVGRFHLRDRSIPSISIDDLCKKFQQIIQESNLTTKSATTSTIVTRDDRIKWWNLRFTLDLKVKEILHFLEKYVFGGFKSVFESNEADDQAYLKFRDSFQTLLTRSIKSSKNILFDDSIINLFYNLTDFETSDVEDLFQILQDSVLACDINAKLDHVCFLSSVESLFKQFKRNKHQKDHHIILVPNGICNHFPWESLEFLKEKSITRAPSYSWLQNMLEINSIPEYPKTLYLVNPDGDLQNTENRLRPIILAKKSELWYGYVGQVPVETELMNKLTNSDLFLYLGHGCCQQYVKPGTMFEYKLVNGHKIPPALLIGCSSASLKSNGILNPTGSVQNWLLCESPMVIGNLWDVTDKDIDMFSLSVMAKAGMIEKNAKSATLNFSQAISKSRNSCTLKYLNGSAPIMYGLPLAIRDTRTPDFAP